MTPTEMSAELRRRALDAPPFDGVESEDEPYGMITEFVQGQTVVTLAAFATGDVSLYFSTGGGSSAGLENRPSRSLRGPRSKGSHRWCRSSNAPMRPTCRSREISTSMS
jgi:hypothetical protein